MNGVDFLLGAHQPGWLARLEVPLFVSHRTLRDRKQLPRARPVGAGFGRVHRADPVRRLADHPRGVRRAVARYQAMVGNLSWASPQNWMCEPAMLRRTGLTVAEHQARTVDNYCARRQAAPTLPFIPVLQGWTLDDHLACVDRYAEAGVDLRAMPLVGLGSVCRRQASGEISQITTTLAALGLRLHGFGVKHRGLAGYADSLHSADSLAWSYAACRRPPLPGSTTHRNCARCPRYALAWRQRLTTGLDGPRQLRLGAVP